MFVLGLSSHFVVIFSTPSYDSLAVPCTGCGNSELFRLLREVQRHAEADRRAVGTPALHAGHGQKNCQVPYANSLKLLSITKFANSNFTSLLVGF
jgi:hypothetical protein